MGERPAAASATEHESRRKGRAVLQLAAILGLTGCLPTPQSARIDPGPRLAFSAVRLSDQHRDGRDQRTDYLTTVEFSYGVGHRYEIGLPLGLYSEGGVAGRSGDRTFVLLPYAKLALLPDASRHHLAATMQFAYLAFVPANVGLHYSRDLGSWEPQVGLTWIPSSGPAGDSPLVTRYQQAGQLMLVPAIGITWPGAVQPMVQTGLLINRYEEGAAYGDFGQPARSRTLVDLFVSLQLTLR